MGCTGLYGLYPDQLVGSVLHAYGRDALAAYAAELGTTWPGGSCSQAEAEKLCAPLAEAEAALPPRI